MQYRVLFPGEAFERVQGTLIQSPKQSVWALYCRSMLLWNGVSRRRQNDWSGDRRARYAIDAFHEVRSLQEAVDMHQCNLDTALLYLCREYLYK